MATTRTRAKNALKRRKRRLQRQLEEDLHSVLHEGCEASTKEALEAEYMANEENTQRVHAAWITANATADAAFAKRQRILAERQRLMESIKQQVEQEKMEIEAAEKERAEAMESLRLEREEADEKHRAQVLASMSPEKQREVVCAFYARTGTCRFGANCTRYHTPVTSSRFLLVQGMHAIQLAADDALEIDEKQLRRAYAEFYNDVLAEFLKFGFVVQLTTCCNLAPHLRGNVYVEYQTEAHAAAAVHALFGRFYAGKQLYPTLVPMDSWAQGICGLYQQRRCTRGRDCNYLHPFATPVEDTPSYRFRRRSSPHRDDDTPPRKLRKALRHRSDDERPSRHRSDTDRTSRHRTDTDRTSRHRTDTDRTSRHRTDTDRASRHRTKDDHRRKSPRRP